VIEKNGSLRGFTVLGDDLFVSRGRPGELDVHNSSNLTFTHKILIPAPNIEVMAACSRYNLLYISDPKQKIIQIYDNVLKKFTKSWSVGGVCSGLSITKSYNLLVTLQDSNKIQEYTREGRLVKEIVLDRSINGSQHCVQLSTNRYVVSHEGDELHRVCIVDTKGDILVSYGGAPGSKNGQLDGPRQITVDERGCILVADSHNKRVEMLTFELSHLMFVTLPGVTLFRPQTVHFNEQQDRLYIGELDGRLFVLKLNKPEEQLELH